MNEIKGSKKLLVTLKKNKKDKMVDGITASPQVACMVGNVLSGDRIASVLLLFVTSISVCVFEMHLQYFFLHYKVFDL